MTATVATKIAQISPRPNFAPASPEVATVPASRNPPVAVTMPSVSESHFFMSCLPPEMLCSHDPEQQPGHASRKTYPDKGNESRVSRACTDSAGAGAFLHQELLFEKARFGQVHQVRSRSSQS